MAGSFPIKTIECEADRTFDVLVLILLARKHLDELGCFIPD